MQTSDTESTLPRRVIVKEVVDSRYGPGLRPLSWDERTAGVERIRDHNGQEVALYSNGGQSSPAPGWELLLTAESKLEGEDSALEWTLYGILSPEEKS